MVDAIAYRIEGKITEEDMKNDTCDFLKKKSRRIKKLIVYQEVVSIGRSRVRCNDGKIKVLV